MCIRDRFHIALPDAVREQQGGRCMNCGVPFCQTGMLYEGRAFGCPLHNLIPEWNDMILSGNRGHALSRLLKSNNFPEFTGRVCPAPCEQACICGIYGDAVTIRDNELCIIEAVSYTHLRGNPSPPSATPSASPSSGKIHDTSTFVRILKSHKGLRTAAETFWHNAQNCGPVPFCLPEIVDRTGLSLV